MARPQISDTENLILGQILTFLDSLINNATPAVFGESGTNLWLTYDRLKKVFDSLTKSWAMSNCWTRPELERVVAEIRWKIRLLDPVNPLYPKEAPPKLNLPLKKLEVEDHKTVEGHPGPMTVALKATEPAE